MIFPLEISATTTKDDVPTTSNVRRDSFPDAEGNDLSPVSENDISSDSLRTILLSDDKDLPKTTRTGRLVKIPKKLNL